MVGRRDAPMYHCGLCSDSFVSKVAHNKHMAAHEEPETTQWSCPKCSFKFKDAHALENHKAQTGHSDAEHSCEKCGEVFQSKNKFRLHSQFPSPCYADASRTRPIRNTSSKTRKLAVATPTHAKGQGGFVDLDMPVSVEDPTIPSYGNSANATSRSSTPSNESGVYCHDCKRSFTSEALFNRHCLSCAVQNRSVAYPNATADATHRKHDAIARSSAETTRFLDSQRNDEQFAHLQAPPVAAAAPAAQGRQPHPASAPFPRAPDSASASSSMVKYCLLGDCGRSFQSQAALDQHQRDSHRDKHLNFVCTIESCRGKFESQDALEQHRKSNHICDVHGCGKPFGTKAGLMQHKQQHHIINDQGSTSQVRKPRPVLPSPALSPQAAGTKAPAVLPSGPTPHAATSGSLICGVGGCSKTFRSEAGLKQHKADSHGVGSQGLDLHGRDSWMLSQAVRNQLREVGLLRPSSTAAQRPRRPPPGRGRGGPPTVTAARQPQAPSAIQQMPRNPVSTPMPPASASNSVSLGGPAEIEQATELQGKIMRMLINTDFAIQHDGKIVYDSVSWRRIGVAKHDEAVRMIDELIHLRKLSKKGQAKQHVSHPTTFEADFAGDYSSSDFEQLPEPRGGSLDVVALCCSKVMLENRCEEVVKVAAIDVLTGCPLMSYLVCTDPTEQVRDWRTSLTGLSSFQDLEFARLQRFKVLKGWKAARAALGKFVDQDTILLGYNLRSDLDALRIRHGRCVDLVKLVEKAAENRPLSKRQLRLETLVRDISQVQLQTDNFGRDCLQDAFAVRELVLLYIKQNDMFVRYAKEKALEYQRAAS